LGIHRRGRIRWSGAKYWDKAEENLVLAERHENSTSNLHNSPSTYLSSLFPFILIPD
jgi:hypothetical protein